MERIIILGAGLAGITLANQLVEKYSVILVERGPAQGMEFPENSFLNRQFGSSNTYCYGVGGTTHLWHNGLIPLNPNELTPGPLADSLISTQDKIDQAANMLQFSGSYSKEYECSLERYRKVANDLSLDAELDTILMPNRRPLLKPSEKVELKSGCTVIDAFYSGEHLTEIKVKHAGGEEVLTADLFIVSAGGVSSPKVLNTLLPQEINSPASKCLIDHPMGFLGKIRVKKNYQELLGQFANKDVGDYTARCGIVTRNNGLRHITYFRPAATMSNKLGIYQYKSKLGTSSLLGRIKCIFNPKIFHPDILHEIFLHLTGKSISTRTFSVWFVFEQNKKIANDNYVVLDSNASNKISWSLSDAEINSYLESISNVENLLAPYCDNVSFVKENIDRFLWSAAHHSGTVAFGSEPGSIDDNFKVNGTKNLYVCDASIVNEHGYSNTGLTISLLTIKLSEHLKGLCK
ncbi:MAG: GMC oxidoreductase [Acidimicrobiaceae bacterium]|nr:GMC oxidoreductase [Acidimicrobiaceae bacterium]